MKNYCPASNKSNFVVTQRPGFFQRNKQVADIKPDNQIIGLITISTTKYPKLLDLWLNARNPQFILTIYKFETEPVLKT